MSQDVDCLLIGYEGGYNNIVNSIIPSLDQKLGRVEKVFYAAVAYLGTYLSNRGLTFDYINHIEDEYDIFVDKIKTNRYRAIGISTTFYPDLETLMKVVRKVREVASSTEIILGGPFIARILDDFKNVEELKRHFLLKRINADIYINSYRGEDTLVNILRALRGEILIDQVPNIFYKDGEIFKYSKTFVEDKNKELSIVDWSLFANRVGKVVPVQTSLSCPFSCSYCTYPINAGKYRYISDTAVEKEFNTIAQIESIKSIHIIDDTFNVPVSRFKEILKLMIKNKYKFSWHSFIRSQFLDEETAEIMKESNCEGVILGVESGSQKMLDIMNKHVKVEELRRGIAILNRYNITNFSLYFMGFPGETLDTVKETIEFIEDTKPTFYSVQPWFYDIRTPISSEKEKYKIKGSFNEWSHETMNVATAKRLVDETILSIKSSIYIGFFSTSSVLQLLHSGVSKEQIKGIVEKAINKL